MDNLHAETVLDPSHVTRILVPSTFSVKPHGLSFWYSNSGREEFPSLLCFVVSALLKTIESWICQHSSQIYGLVQDAGSGNADHSAYRGRRNFWSAS